MAPSQTENLITTKEAGEIYGYTPDYFARLARSGKISGKRVGHSWLIERESLESFIASQDNHKIDYARELSRAREAEYRAHRAVVRRATRALMDSMPTHRTRAVAVDQLRSQILALSVALLVVVMGAFGARAAILPRLTQAIAEIANETAYGFDSALGDISSRIIARVGEAGTDRSALSEHIAENIATVSENLASSSFSFVGANLSLPQIALVEERRVLSPVAFVAHPGSITLAPITIEDVQASVLAVYEFITTPSLVAIALARAHSTLGADAYVAINESLFAYRSFVERAGEVALTLGAVSRDAFAFAPRFVDRANLAFGTAVISAAHAAIRADVAIAYGLAEAAPASARAATELALSAGDALSSAVSRAPALATALYLRATAAPAELAPRLAHTVFGAEYAAAARFVSLSDRASGGYLALVEGAGRLAYSGTTGALAFSSATASSVINAPTALENAYLGAFGRAALAFDTLANIPLLAAANAGDLSGGERAALATYETLSGFMRSAHGAFASIFGSSSFTTSIPSPPAIVMPSVPQKARVAVATSTPRVAAPAPRVVNSYPTYTTVVQGVSSDIMNRSLATLRADVLAMAAAMVRPVAAQTATNLTTIQQVNMIQDLSNLIVRNGDFRGGSLTNGVLVSATTGNFTNLNGGTTNLGATTIIGNLSVSGTTTPGIIAATDYISAPYFVATSTTATSTFSTGGFTVGTSQFVVQQTSGNVGVGTASPSYPLHVAGQCVTADTRLRRRRRKQEGEEADPEKGEWEDGEYIYDLPMIKDVRANDDVRSLDMSSGALEWSRVNGIMYTGIQNLIRITTQSGRSIRTTAVHPYFVHAPRRNENKTPQQKLYRFYADQSVRFDEYARDTYIAIANEEQSFVISIPRLVKQALRDAVPDTEYRKVLASAMFGNALALLSRISGLRMHELVIDTEYTGMTHESIVAAILKGAGSGLAVSFEQVGKKSPAHKAAYGAFIGKRTSDITAGTDTLFAQMEHVLGGDPFRTSHNAFIAELRPARSLQGDGGIALAILRKTLWESGIVDGIKTENALRTALYGYIHPAHHSPQTSSDNDRIGRSARLVNEGLWIQAQKLKVGHEIAVVYGDTPSWERVTKVEHLPAESVYDVEIEGTHNFIGNDIVAHNTYIGGDLTVTGQTTLANASTTQIGSTGSAYFATSGGSVGIGTTSPSTRFSVGGAAGDATGHGYFTGGLGVGVMNTVAGTFQTTGAATFGGALTVNGQCVTADTRLRRRRRRADGSYEEDEVMIKDVEAGDEIQSLDEKTGKLVWSKVKQLAFMGKKQTYRIVTEDGRSIRTTANHPYLTDRGWKKVAELKEGMMVAVATENDRDAMVNEIATLADGDFGGSKIQSSSKPGFVIPIDSVANGLSMSSARITVDKLKPAEGIEPSSQRMTNPDLLQAAGVRKVYHDTIAWERIISLEPIAEEDVYDVEIEGTHNFIGNDIVAHNTYIGGNLTVAGDTTLGSLSGFIAGNSGALYAVATSSLFGFTPTPFAWTPQSWGNSTSTTLGFLNGFLSTASSTFTASTNFPSGIWNSSGNVGIGTASPATRLAVLGTTATDLPTYGSELLTSAGWTVNAGWTESPDDTFAHAGGGGTATLTHSATIASATKYQISWTVTGRTAGSFTVAVGGQSLGSNTATNSFGPTTTSTASFTITPTTDFDGTISLTSLKQITAASTALATLLDSSSTARLEMRANSTTNNYNTFVGINAGAYNTTGSSNSALGVSALRSNTTGYSNSALGLNALYSNTTGSSNSAMGVEALRYNTTGYSNSALGLNAGRFITDGSTANQTSNNSLYLGSDTRALASGDTNEIVIGASAIGLGSNTVVLGNSSITTTALRGNVGIGTTSPYSLLSLSNNLNTPANTPLFTIASTTGGTATSTLMTVLANGNVGIGTERPAQILHTVGAIQLESSNSGVNAYIGAGDLYFGPDLSGTGIQFDYFASKLYIGRPDGSLYPLAIQDNGNVGFSTTSPWGLLSVNANGIGSAPQFVVGSSTKTDFIVTNAGNVGVGTASPAYPLHVAGQCVTADTRLRRRRKKKEGECADAEKGELEDSEYIYDTVMVKDVLAGDEIASMHQITGSIVWSRVNALMFMGSKDIWALRTKSGRLIRTTENHPYFVRASSRALAQKLYRFEADISNKVEHLSKDTVVAVSSGEHSATALITAEAKRELLAEWRDAGAAKRFAPSIYAALIAEALARLPVAVHELFIDTDYEGYDALITNVVKRAAPDVTLHFARVGKKSPAHHAAYRVHARLALADARITRETLGEKTENALRTPSRSNLSAERFGGPQALSLPSKVFDSEQFVKEGVWTLVKDLRPGREIAVVYGEGERARVAWEPIVSIAVQRPEPVYDIEIEGTHNFIGNDIVAHNTYIGGNLTVASDATIGSLSGLVAGNSGALYAVASSSLFGFTPTPFAWTPQSWGNSTSTTLGFLNGFLSTASSTFTASTNFPSGIWNSSGNVGIGTTIPNSKLEVAGNISAPGAGSDSERFGRLATAAGIGAVSLGQGASAGGSFSFASGYYANASGVHGIAIGYTAAVAHTDSIAIGYGAASTADNQLVMNNINEAYLGSGVTSATAHLLTFQLRTSGGNGTDKSGTPFILGAGRSTGSANGGYLSFETTPAGTTGTTLNSSVERMRIDSAGNVGIGTTSPSTRFSVGGAAGDVTGHGYFTGGLGVGVVNTVAGTFQTTGAATFGGALTVNGQCVTADTRLRRRRRRADGSYEEDEVMIKDVEAGDEIQSLDEKTGKLVWSKVKQLAFMGKKQTYRIVTEDGRSIRTTANHPYLTSRGWRKVSELREGVEIAVTNESVTDLSMIDLRNKESAFISKSHLKPVVSNAHSIAIFRTAEFNNMPMLERVGTLAQDNQLALDSDARTLGEAHEGLLSPWMYQDDEHENYLALRLLTPTNGTHELALSASRMSRFSLATSSDVESSKKSIKSSNIFLDMTEDGATMPRMFSSLIIVMDDLFMTGSITPSVARVQPEYAARSARGAEKGVKWAKISSIEPVALEDVYDIEVEGTHNFIGNDIVAHNTAVFNQASTTMFTNSGNTWLTGLSASSLLATDQNNMLISTTSIGTSLLSGIMTIAQGGTATGTQVTNGVNYFDGTRITSGTALTFDGTKLFANYASTTAITSTGSAYFATSAGNVGIGTTSPWAKLSVTGASDLGNFGYAGYFIATSTTATSTFSGGFVAGNNAAFSVNRDAVANSLSIATNGNVGIGTTSPWGLLSVNANGIGSAPQFAVGSSTKTDFVITNAGNIGIGTTGPGQKLQVVSATDNQLRLGTEANYFDIGRVVSSGFLTIQGSQTGFNSIVLAPTSGNVGIGTTGPRGPMHVSGGTNAYSYIQGTGGGGTAFGSSDTIPMTGGNGLTGYGGLALIPDRWGNASTVDAHTVLNLAGSQRNSGAIASTLAFSNWGYFTGTGSGAGGLGNATAQGDAVKFKIEFHDVGSEFSQRLDFITRSASAVNVTAMSILSNGNVGIGDTGPTAKLAVGSAVADTQGIRSTLTGTGTNYAVMGQAYGAGTANTGFYANAYGASNNYGVRIVAPAAGANNYAIYADGTAQSYFAGNVGIGTASPGYKLEVSGSAVTVGRFTTSDYTGKTLILNSLNNGGNGPGILFTNDAVTAGLAQIQATDVGNYGGNLKFLVHANNGANNWPTGATTALFLQYDGNVGIGTVAPGAKLAVSGISYLGVDQSDYIVAQGAGGTARLEVAGVDTNVNLALSTKGTGSTYFWRGGYGGTASMFIDGTNGNVGIGTTGPNAALEISRYTGTLDTALRLKGGNSASYYWLDVQNDFYDSSNGKMRWNFNTNDFASGSKTVMSLLATGNVGIGTTGPGQKLDVAGSIVARNGFGSFIGLSAGASDGAPLVMTAGQPGEVTTGGILGSNWIPAAGAGSMVQVNTLYNSSALYFHSATTNYGTLVYRQMNPSATQVQTFTIDGSVTPVANTLYLKGGNVGIGTTVPDSIKLDVEDDIEIGTGTTGCVRDADNTTLVGSCVSDRQLKTNITAFPSDTLDKLAQLTPVSFEWRNDEFSWLNGQPGTNYGLIAQDVEQVFPEMVHTDDKGYKRVSYDIGLSMRLLEGIRELDVRTRQILGFGGVLSIAPGVESQCVTGDTRIRRRRRRADGSFEFDEVDIKDIAVGDEIASLDEASGRVVYSRVNALIDMGTQEVFELVTKSGRRIRTTSNHPFLARERATNP